MIPFENQKLMLLYHIRDKGRNIIIAIYDKLLYNKCKNNENKNFQIIVKIFAKLYAK